MADGEEAGTEYAIGWEPQPGPQTALLACPVFEVFCGGKTDGMLGEWASLLTSRQECGWVDGPS